MLPFVQALLPSVFTKPAQSAPVSCFQESISNPCSEFFLVIIALASIFMIAGCRGSGKAELQHTEKMDAPLRVLLSGQQDSATDSKIQVLIEMASVPDSHMLSLFEQHGIRVAVVSGNIVAASGKAADIRRIAAEDAVVSLSLSMERQLHQ